MPLAVDPKAYVIGPSYPFYRAVGVLTPWTSLGVLLDDAVMRVTTRWADTQGSLSGVSGPVQGLDVLAEVNADMEWTMPELIGTKFGKAIPGAVITTESGADASGSPLSTTTTAAAAVGATTISLTSATNAAVGDWFRIEAAASPIVEMRQITAIATLDISFRDPLAFAHDSGAAVVEVDNGKRTVITAPVLRRQPDSAYDNWALVTESGRSTPTVLEFPVGISQTETAEVTIGDETLSGIRMTIAARRPHSDVTKSPFILSGPSV